MQNTTKQLLFNNLHFSFIILHLVALAVFCCFTGLAYIDMKNLTSENIRKSFDGKMWIITKRQKCHTPVNVPLMTIPKMILEKYKGKLPNGKILPVISNQKTNQYLKEIADVCDIKKKLTFHMRSHCRNHYLLNIRQLQRRLLK